MDPSRAPVAFGRLAVPQLFAELQQPEEERRLPALASLCDLLHDPELIHQTLAGGTARPPRYPAFVGPHVSRHFTLLYGHVCL